jgi:hypothetical protein
VGEWVAFIRRDDIRWIYVILHMYNCCAQAKKRNSK